MSVSDSLSRIRRAGLVVELRMRFGRVLEIMPIVLSIALGLATLALAAHKVFPQPISAGRTRLAFYWIAGASVFALLAAALRRLAPRAGAIALDRVHSLTGRLTNALEFEALPEGERTPLMQAAIDDALAHAKNLSPSKAAPIRFPLEMLFVVLMGGGLYLVTLLEIRTLRPEVPKQSIDALVMTADDLDLFRDAAKELERGDQSPETKAALERFNRLIEDLAEHRLDRAEAFRQMEAIERDLLEGQKADQDKLKEELNETAKQLAKSDLAKDIAEALKKNDLKQTQKEMKDLAQKLRDKKTPPDKR